MLHSISNSKLTVTVNDHGAELWSIKDGDTEYLWQGDNAFWDDRSPNLFPYIGRMINKQYSYSGNIYPMNIHGIAMYSDFILLEKSDAKMVFVLSSSTESLQQYPWEFTFKVIYELIDCKLSVTFEVTNNSQTTMLFAVGGHPGFNIPAEHFTSYALRFEKACQPQRIIFTNDCFVEDRTEPYALVNGTDIPLRHDLFDNDAIVLKNTAKAVTLTCGEWKAVTVEFPKMEYIGFWHAVGMACPYVCIEPWSSLPSPKGTQTVLENQKDLLTLDAGNTYTNTWSIAIDGGK